MGLDTPSITTGLPVVVRIQDAEVSQFLTAQCSVHRVEVDADEPTLTVNVNLELTSGSGTIAVPTRDLLTGIYRVAFVALIPGSAADPTEAGAVRIVPDRMLFEIVDAQAHAQRTVDDLRAAYDAIVTARNADLMSGIGFTSDDSLEFESLVFVKNCSMQTPMRLGQLQLVPLGGLSCEDEIALIDAFLAKNGHAPLTETAEVVRRAQAGQPCLAIHFPRVHATCLDQAGEIVLREASLLCDVLALHRNSYGAAFGGVLVRRDTGSIAYWIETPTYTGNLLGGALAGEYPRAIRAHLDKARTTPQVALYLSLLREALREERTEFAYFRFWNLLETIARAKGFQGRPLLDWSGSQKLSPKKGVPLFIQERAEELVFELLRTTLAGHTSRTGVGSRLGQPSFEELVPIWYRHRNCVVHGGGCFPEDSSFCLRTEDKYVKCKGAHDEMVSRHQARRRRNDEYLAALTATVLWVMEIESA
jgi:hypothetical protein